MKHPSAYLRMRVLGAIEYAQGKSIRERIKQVSLATFTDEQGHPRHFTWRTISTWLYRYKVDGITTMMPKTRSDKGKARKMPPEELLEAINQVLPFLKAKNPTLKCRFIAGALNWVWSKKSNWLKPPSFALSENMIY